MFPDRIRYWVSNEVNGFLFLHAEPVVILEETLAVSTKRLIMTIVEKSPWLDGEESTLP